ncbi:hypothetical protein D9M72_340890 [compost metagenome]
MQAVEFVQLGAASLFSTRHARSAGDGGGGAGRAFHRARLGQAGCLALGELGDAALEIGEPRFGFAAGGEDRLERLLALFEIGAGAGQRLVQSGKLRFQIDLACDAGFGEVLSGGGDRGPDLFVQFREIGADFVAAAEDAVFLGTRLSDIDPGFFGGGVDFAERLFDDHDLVAAFRLVDGGIGETGDQAAHAR